MPEETKEKAQRRGMIKIYRWFGGKSMFYAFLILVIGSAALFTGKLNTHGIALFGLVQTLVTARSVLQDRLRPEGDKENG